MSKRAPLADYRAEELERMRMNFYGFDPSYHIARHRFVYRTPHAWTPLHLARHRRWRRPARAGECMSAALETADRELDAAAHAARALAHRRARAGRRLPAVRLSPRASLRAHRLGAQLRRRGGNPRRGAGRSGCRLFGEALLSRAPPAARGAAARGAAGADRAQREFRILASTRARSCMSTSRRTCSPAMSVWPSSATRRRAATATRSSTARSADRATR